MGLLYPREMGGFFWGAGAGGPGAMVHVAQGQNSFLLIVVFGSHLAAVPGIIPGGAEDCIQVTHVQGQRLPHSVITLALHSDSLTDGGGW